MLAGKLLPLGGSRPLPTFVSASSGRLSSRSVTLSAPSGIQDGDLLVFVGMSDAASQTFQALPSGFSAISTQAGSLQAMAVAIKTASSESGSYFFEFASPGSSGAASLLVYRNATRVNTVGVLAEASATATSTASSITPTYQGVLLSAFANETSSGANISTPPAGLTNRVNLTGSGAQAIAIYELSPQSAAATSSYSMVWSGSSTTTALQLQITNEPDVEPDFVAMAQTQNTSTGTSLVINKPTGTVEGDLMIAMMAADGGAVWTGDTGWTEVADRGFVPSNRIAYKVAGAAEGSSYTFTSDASGLLSGTILTYRYAAYDTIAGSFTASANPLVLTSISPTASQSILIAAGARQAAGVTLGTPTSMTARATDNDATGPSYIVCDQSVAAGPTGTRSMSTGSTSGVSGIMLSIKPTRSL